MTALPFSVDGLDADACIEAKRELAMADGLQCLKELGEMDDISACDAVRIEQACSGVSPLRLS